MFFSIIYTDAFIHYQDAGNQGQLAITASDATNFYVGNATSYDWSANASGNAYYWTAIG